MSDRAEITALVARFHDAVNRRDVAEFSTLWTEDPVWEIGDPRPLHVAGGASIVATWQRMVGAIEFLGRGSFAGMVRVEGDRTTGRWPCVETGRFTDGSRYDNHSLYEHVYRRTADGWRFAHRRYLYFWLSDAPLPGAAVALGAELG